MLTWLLNLIRIPILLVLGAALLAVGLCQLDQATPWVREITQKMPALEGPVNGVKTSGALLLENGAVLFSDTQKSFFPDSQTRMLQAEAEHRIDAIDIDLKARQDQIMGLQNQIHVLENEKGHLMKSARPFYNWLPHRDHTQKETKPDSHVFQQN